MKIIYKKPWFWWIVQLFYPNAEWGSVIMTFGDTIYTHKILTKTELTHEMVHLKQDHYSKIVAIFWVIYHQFNKKHYLECEIEAYQAENKIEYNPEKYARDLSSPVYNNLITYEDALNLFI